ncbi:hypothetical protein N2152v2_000311 [Parachlorella kessleri]
MTALSSYAATAACLLLLITSLASADNAVIVFNNQAQGRVREQGIQNQISAKVYALTHIAQLLAVDETASEKVQAAQAAYAGHTVLNLLFPWAFYKHDAALKNFTTSLSPQEKAAASQAGRAAGLAVVADRLDDGFDKWVSFTPAPANGPVGAYQFTPNQTYALYPQLANVTTILLPANQSAPSTPPASQFSSKAEIITQPWGISPLTVSSSEYTTELQQVFTLGKKGGTNQTNIDTANFWADGNTTSTVTGHWNQIAQAVIPANISTAEAALLFARLNAAVWDASIVGWGVKYSVLFWRPITAIRQGDGIAANSAFVDANWTPTLATPPHPEYPSGHSISSGAAAGVLANYFGTDEVPFTIGTEFPGLSPRSYSSFSQAVDEVGYSRVVGGIHFNRAVVDGATLGYKVADYIDEYLSKAALAS